MKFSVIQPNIQWRKGFHRNYLYLTGIVCAIITGRLLPGYWIAAALLLSLTVFLLYNKFYRETLMLVCAAVAGYLAVGYQAYNSQVQGNRYLENAAVKITDSGAVGPIWASGDLAAKHLNALYNGRLIQLYIPDNLANSGFYEGMVYRVSGNLYALNTAPEFFMADKRGGWVNVNERFQRSGYYDYLARNHIQGILHLEECRSVRQSEPSKLAVLRRALDQRLDSKIDSPINRAVLGAVTLGLRHRLTGGNKKFYAAVGLAHLFSISGLHVGVLSAIILLLMRPLPSWLHIPAAGTLICYVLTVGGNAPAVRAFVMVLMLVIFRSYFLRCRALEVLSMICGVFLLINPYYITDAGFLYSFVITAILIKSAELGRVIVLASSGAENIMGNISRFRRLFCKWRGRVAGAVFFAMVAAAGSMSLTLFFQNLFFAGSMLINLAVLPVLLPLYLLAIGKIIMPGWADFWNVPLNWLVEYLQFAARLGNEFAGNSPFMHISHWTAILFVLLLMLLITVAYKRVALIVLGGLLLIIFVMIFRSGTAPQRVYAAIYGGRLTYPVTAIILPQAHTMYLLNCGYDAIPPLLDIAACYGVTQVERLDFGRAVARNSDGLRYLSGNMPVLKYRKSSLPVRSNVFRKHTAHITLEPGAETDSLSINTLNAVPEMKYVDNTNGTLTWQCNKKKYSLERTRYPRAYIVEQY